jgi:hypothetical protein
MPLLIHVYEPICDLIIELSLEQPSCAKDRKTQLIYMNLYKLEANLRQA